jgi:outer membrane protein OmpA-like peptidoglycan-associated protein
MRSLIFCFLLLMAYGSNAQTQTIDISTLDLQWSNNVYFTLGSSTLTPAAKHTIDSLLYNDVLVKGRMVGVIGYTDNIGGEEGNKDLSVKRANAVAAYLRYVGIDSMYIEQVTGMGEIARTEKQGGYPLDRKVSILPGGFLKADKVVWTDSGTLVASLYYNSANWSLRPESAMLLDTVVKILKNNPRMKVRCDGYVCCHMFRAYGPSDITASGLTEEAFRTREADTMSQQWAIRTYLHLKKNGIDTSRMRYAGYGFHKNIKHGSNRVEIRAVSK